MRRSKGSVASHSILPTLLGLALIVLALPALAADTLPAPVESPMIEALAENPAITHAAGPATSAVGGSCPPFTPCSKPEDCAPHCTGNYRCDAGGCLGTEGPAVMSTFLKLDTTVLDTIAPEPECTDDEDCLCPNGGRCEKNSCLCY